MTYVDSNRKIKAGEYSYFEHVFCEKDAQCFERRRKEMFSAWNMHYRRAVNERKVAGNMLTKTKPSPWEMIWIEVGK